MSISPAERLEFLTLLHALREEQLTDEQGQRVNELVKRDEATRRFYVDHLLINAALRWSHLNFDPAQVNLPSHAAKSTDVVAPSDASLLGVVLRHLPHGISPVLFSTLAVAAAFYGLFVGIAWNLRSGEPLGIADQEGLVVARVSDATDVRWSPDTIARKTDSPVHAGDPFKIDSGLVELELQRGAKLVVEGPAEWSIDGDNGATLHRGKLVARVPRRAVGFTIQTPASSVVDLGTEFALQVDDKGATEVQVLDGKVVLKPSNTKSTQLAQPEIVLKAGMARRVHAPVRDQPTSVKEIEWNPQSFVRYLRADKPQVKTTSEKLLEMQSFDSNAAAELAGWTGNTLNRDASASGNDYGFSDSTHTRGSSSGGEAGGVFARHGNTTIRSFYADTELGGTFTIFDPLYASGDLYIKNPAVLPGHDAFVAVGFFNSKFFGTGVGNAADDVMGFFLRSDNTILATAFGSADDGIGSNGEPLELTNISRPLPSGNYRFEMTWTPYRIAGPFAHYANPGSLRVKIYDAPGNLEANLATAPAPTQRRTDRLMDAFGLMNRGNVSTGPGRGEYFLDNLTYTSRSVSSQKSQLNERRQNAIKRADE